MSGQASPTVQVLAVTAPAQIHFFLNYTPVVVEDFYINGQRQTPGTDYVMFGNRLTWISSDFATAVTDVLVAVYNNG